jgi:hypothetical protein
MVSLEHVRKVVVVGYDTNVVKGTHATVFAAKPDGDQVIEKKEIANHGHATLAFPHDYSGECYVEIHGSREGEDTGTISV